MTKCSKKREKPFFSVIVPVYNVEPFLVCCIESILNQDDCDFELLLIDDGSTDGSGAICDRFAQSDYRIRAFHKPNGGLSDARNYGIDRAIGQYLVFVDSDDWIDLHSFSEFRKALANGADVLITRMVEVYDDRKVYLDETFKQYLAEPLTRKRAIQWIFSKSENGWPAVKYVLSSDFVNRGMYRFETGRLHEDVAWCSNVITQAERFAGADVAWYFYRRNRNDSITNKIGAKNIVDVIEMTASFHKKHNFRYNAEEVMICRKLTRGMMFRIAQIGKCDAIGQREVIQSLLSHPEVLDLRMTRKYNHCLIALSCKLFGVSRTMSFLARLS